MRQFAGSGFRAWNLSTEAKLIYTCFALFAMLALASSVLFYEHLVGGGVAAYYAGEAAAPAATGGGGPEIAVPDEKPLRVAMPYGKLLEVSHFHLFTVPVFLLIIAHLFMLTGASRRAKLGWIGGAWAAALVHLAAPWLVRYGGGAFSSVYAVSGAALGVTSTVLTVWPIGSMWLGGAKEQASP